MEGLIPLVFKTIKRNRTRSQYEYLSSGTASAGHHQMYNITDFYTNDDSVIRNSPEKTTRPANLQRHHQSFHYGSSDSANKKELVRFRNHRRMFSCMPGC
ncbi:hypothetical protein LIER_33983 [Lithospermum erythrorhizon]|uniref:Uncharacterized protein n=1 Tax=Lithospermum erythrorhizon TaxID=34254 RepID=A0AAV3S1J0_LITER